MLDQKLLTKASRLCGRLLSPLRSPVPQTSGDLPCEVGMSAAYWRRPSFLTSEELASGGASTAFYHPGSAVYMRRDLVFMRAETFNQSSVVTSRPLLLWDSTL